MNRKKIDIILQIALALIAAIVVDCLVCGLTTWGWIIAYWCVLTVKNVVDLW